MNTTLKTVLLAAAAFVLAGGLFLSGRIYDRWEFAGSSGLVRMPMFAAPGAGPGWNGPRDRHGTIMGNGDGPMMGWSYGSQLAGSLSIDQARNSAQRYLDALALDGLTVEEIMIFDNNAYVVIREESTGLGAFELLVDPVSKAAYPEHGPNMTWNLKYGGLNHGGMMGGQGMGGMMFGGILPGVAVADVAADMPISEEGAVESAQSYLDRYLPGAIVSGHATQFYGYYTLDYARDGQVAGMVSVNGFSAQVFPHNWHGTFIEESE